jgi:hypothetical protein
LQRSPRHMPARVALLPRCFMHTKRPAKRLARRKWDMPRRRWSMKRRQRNMQRRRVNMQRRHCHMAWARRNMQGARCMLQGSRRNMQRRRCTLPGSRSNVQRTRGVFQKRRWGRLQRRDVSQQRRLTVGGAAMAKHRRRLRSPPQPGLESCERRRDAAARGMAERRLGLKTDSSSAKRSPSLDTSQACSYQRCQSRERPTCIQVPRSDSRPSTHRSQPSRPACGSTSQSSMLGCLLSISPTTLDRRRGLTAPAISLPP